MKDILGTTAILAVLTMAHLYGCDDGSREPRPFVEPATVGGGGGFDVGQDHWLRVLNKFTSIAISLIVLFIVLFVVISILVVAIFGITKSANLLNTLGLLSFNIITLVLAHTCPIMSGSILLFFRRS